jgi:hypothetical protein
MIRPLSLSLTLALVCSLFAAVRPAPLESPRVPPWAPGTPGWWAEEPAPRPKEDPVKTDKTGPVMIAAAQRLAAGDARA